MAMAVKTWSAKEVHSVILFLWVKHVSAIKIHCQLAEAYGDVLMRVKRSENSAESLKMVKWICKMLTVMVGPEHQKCT